jgi:exopolysaccharide production protein ExoQ
MTRNASLLEVPAAYERSNRLLTLPGLVGFVFTFRICLTFLFFQADPQLGTIVGAVLSLVLLLLAIFCAFGETAFSFASFRTPTVWLSIAFLCMAFVSLSWSEGPALAAAGYWVSWAADIATVLLVLCSRPPLEQALSLMKGAVAGGCLVALVAWCIPAMADLRLGDQDFLHPNVIGHMFALTALLAAYLAHDSRVWRWPAFWLAATLLRTLSKTSILAFSVAALFWLIWDSSLTRAARFKIGAAGVMIIASFWGLLATYLSRYTEGTGPETLTGRTLIWSVSVEYALRRPWLGYGFYSYRAVVPPFGAFEAWHAHDELLQQFFCFGVPGALLVIFLYGALIRQTYRAPRSDVKTLSATLLIFALVRGLTDTEIFDLSYPVWLMILLSMMLRSIERQEKDLGAVC